MIDAELLTIILGGGASILFWLFVRVVLKARQEKRTGTDEQRTYLDNELRRYGLSLVPGETLDQGLYRLEKVRALEAEYSRRGL